jgi:hypothetical protein
MSTATAFQPTPAHQLQPDAHVEVTSKKDEFVPRGPVDARLSFYDPPKDGSKVLSPNT